MIHQIRDYNLTLDDGQGAGVRLYEPVYDGPVPDADAIRGLERAIEAWREMGQAPIVAVFVPRWK